MSEAAARRAVEDVRLALDEVLAGELRALYLFGSLVSGRYRPGYSDVNLLAVTAESTDMESLGRAMRPLWSKHGTVLVNTPLYADEDAVRRHLRLEPVLAIHLASHRQLLSGKDLMQDLSEAGSPDTLARDAYDLMRASSLLFPSNHTEEEQFALERLLSRLAAPEVANRTVQNTEAGFEAARRNLERDLAKFMGVGSGRISREEILATYECGGYFIIVLSALDELHRRVVCDRYVPRSLLDGYAGVMLATPAQLRIALQYEVPADFRLGRYLHLDGHDQITGLEVEITQVWRDLGARSSRLRVAELPHRYVTSSPATLSRVIHDFQNRLLNIQLRSELLSRLTGAESVAPPGVVPDRTSAPIQRLKSLLDQLDWWAGYYLRQMESI